MTEIKGLPNEELLRIDEVAAYFRVSERTIRLWIAHGHLASGKIAGTIRVTRASVMGCRFNTKKKMKTKTIGVAKHPGPTPVDEDTAEPADSGKTKRGRSKRI